MTNLGKYSNNVQELMKLRNWSGWNYLTVKAKKMLNERVKQLKAENDFLVKVGLNQTSEIEVTTVQFESKMNKDRHKLDNSRAFNFDK